MSSLLLAAVFLFAPIGVLSGSAVDSQVIAVSSNLFFKKKKKWVSIKIMVVLLG